VRGRILEMASFHPSHVGDIINLNVGGQRFSTSRQTLTWIPDTFFTSLLSGRIPSLRDESGALFIDRDPKHFSTILNYLRTRELDVAHVDMRLLRQEAEYFGIAPLVKRLVLCEELNHSSCGDVLFYCILQPPSIPAHDHDNGKTCCSEYNSNQAPPNPPSNSPVSTPVFPDNMLSQFLGHQRTGSGHLRNSSLDVRVAAGPSCATRSTSDLRMPRGWTSSSIDVRHSRNSSADLSKHVRNDLGLVLMTHYTGSWTDPLRVRSIKAHHNWIAVAYAHFVCCYRLIYSCGWQHILTSPHVEQVIEHITINANITSLYGLGEGVIATKMVAISCGSIVNLWGITDDGKRISVGTFNLHSVRVEHLFFIGGKLVALSFTGKIGVWHAMSWQVQDVVPITSFDTTGSFLLLGCSNGSIYYIDMQKFPLRMIDNDILVTELYRDQSKDPITAISLYLTPKSSSCGNWIEIAYGTKSGVVKVIVQHPETIGNEPQLFQTFTVHQNPVIKVKLSEKFLVSVCSEYQHVRTWSVNRFRGIISTQPGSTPMASFKIVNLEGVDGSGSCSGPFGDQDDEQVFIQKIVPDTDRLFVRLASTGKRVCVINSVDGSVISSLCVHECEGSSRLGSRPRRFILTGHSSGSVQMWDLSLALELAAKTEVEVAGGPSASELIRVLEQCELSSSLGSTPCMSPCPWPPGPGGPTRIKACNVAFLTNNQDPAPHS